MGNDEYNNDDRVYLLSGEEMGKIAAFLEEGSADYDKLMSGNYCLVAGNDVPGEISGWQFGGYGDIPLLRRQRHGGTVKRQGELKKECEIRLMGSDDILVLSPDMIALLIGRVRASGTRAFSVPAEELLPLGYAEYLAHIFEVNAGIRRRPVDIREVYQKTGGR